MSLLHVADLTTGAMATATSNVDRYVAAAALHSRNLLCSSCCLHRFFENIVPYGAELTTQAVLTARSDWNVELTIHTRAGGMSLLLHDVYTKR